MERLARHENVEQLDSSDGLEIFDELYASPDTFAIHMQEVGRFKIDHKANLRCANNISSGQFALFNLTRMSEELELSERQGAFLNDYFERPKIKRLAKGFTSKITRRISTSAMQDTHDAFMDKIAMQSAVADNEFAELQHLPPYLSEIIVGTKIAQEILICDAAEKALDEMVERNLRLGISVAKKYPSAFLSLEDRCQEAYKGLMVAAATYEPETGFKFSTYAINWARQKVTRAVAELNSGIRIPVRASEDYRVSLKLQDQKVQEIGRHLTKVEAESLVLGKPERFESSGRALKVQSLNRPFSTANGVEMELTDLIESDDMAVEEEGLKSILKAEVQRALEILTPREKETLELRFGMLDNKPWTLEQVGVKFKLTRERVRQIEARALKKLGAVSNLRSFLE